MRKAILIIALAVFAATAVLAAKILRDQRLAALASAPAEQTVSLDPAYVYDVSPGARMRTFDLAVDVTLKKPDAAARVVFDFADAQNHYYAEITPTALRIVVMQDGVGRVIESVEGKSFPVNTPLRVTVKRREPMIRVAVDDEMMAEACDETFYSGKAGTASVEGAAEFSAPRVQAVAEIYFADDFMRAEEEKGPWTELRGSWEVKAIDHASMSANAFQYVAQGPNEAAAVSGFPFWDDYSFEAAVRPTRPATVGLTFYYRDENNYFRFEWSPEEAGSRPEARPEGKPASGAKRLVRMWRGTREVLSESPGGFRINQWYSLKCQATGRRVRAFIDDTLVFDVTDARLTGGMVGLYSAGDCRTYFDDVFVRSHKWFEDRFTNGGRTAWSTMGGEWKRVTLNVAHPPSGEAVSEPQQQQSHPGAGVPHQQQQPPGVLTVRTPEGEARAAVGGESWKDYVLDTEIHAGVSGSSGSAGKSRAGVLLCYQDETRYYQASFAPAADGKETWTLERVLDGKRETLDAKTIPARAGSRKVRAGIKDGYLSVRLNGERVLEGFDTSLASGRGGLFAADAALVSFGPVRIDWPLEEPPLLTLNEIFEHEQSMADWSSVESDWFPPRNGVWINKGNFPGDATLSLEVTSFGKSSQVGLLLSAGDGGDDQGYLLRLSGAGGMPALELLREGVKVASAELPADVKPARVALKRVGSYLVGLVNGRPALVHRDATMLPGDVLGWFAVQAKVDARSVAVSSPNVRKDLFRRAHTDWRVVKGIWEISNRWQCDPRWTFFSGRSSWQLAAIWNKRALEGDVTVDFYAGPKMDSERGGRYEYFSDVNCTLAGDGGDLSSGYSFMFGGWQNTRTVLAKGDKVVAQGIWPANAKQNWMRKGQPAIIPSAPGAAINIHHEWFHIKAQKAGNRLRLWIDDELVIDWTDPDAPLTGKRVALWTWNNGIMVARVSLVADRIGDCEEPAGYLPSRCRCVYDVPDTRASGAAPAVAAQ